MLSSSSKIWNVDDAQIIPKAFAHRGLFPLWAVHAHVAGSLFNCFCRDHFHRGGKYNASERATCFLHGPRSDFWAEVDLCPYLYKCLPISTLKKAAHSYLSYLLTQKPEAKNIFAFSCRLFVTHPRWGKTFRPPLRRGKPFSICSTTQLFHWREVNKQDWCIWW